MRKPSIVCLCGSTRFKEAFEATNRRETMAGRIVLSVGMFGHDEGIDMNGPVKAMLDKLHLAKIDLADEVLVLDCPRAYCRDCAMWLDEMEPGTRFCQQHPDMESVEWRPYIGSSTRNEIAYATSLGKHIRYLSKEQPTP